VFTLWCRRRENMYHADISFHTSTTTAKKPRKYAPLREL
jgi:hypothetical protein